MGIFNRALSPLVAALAGLLLVGAAHAEAPKRDAVPVININTASAGQLSFLPGIGQTKAERVVAYRTKHTFKAVVELARVKGIGLKTVRKLKPWLRVTGETTLAGPVRLPSRTRGDGRAAGGR